MPVASPIPSRPTPRGRRHRPLPRGGVATALALAMLSAACSSSRSSSSAGPSRGDAPSALPHVVGEADVSWHPEPGEVSVAARFFGGSGGRFTIERGVEPFLRDLEVAAEPGQGEEPRWQRPPRTDRRLELPSCVGPCRVRYRIALRQAAQALGDLDWAGMHGSLVEAPPSTWLLTPLAPADGATRRLRFRVTTPAGSGFATGVRRAADSTPAAPVWELDLRDLWTSPYSAFGDLTSYQLPVRGGAIELAIANEPTELPRQDIVDWVTARANAVAGYFGRFPMSGALVLLAVSRGTRIGGGRTLAGGGGTVVLSLGARATATHYERDWVLVHELVHLAFPSVPRTHLWAQEGVATYVEPIARVRAGLMDERAAWRGMMDGLPNGLPEAGDVGLDRTPTWGRIYWGGALYWFLCDLEIRQRTDGRLGLEHALRGMLAAGADNAQRWPLEHTLALGDRAVGVPVLTEQYQAMKAAPHPVDLDALFARLGVALVDGQLVLDDRAPLARIRRLIMHGDDGDAAGAPSAPPQR
jgi:hypothetical protein